MEYEAFGIRFCKGFGVGLRMTQLRANKKRLDDVLRQIERLKN